MKPRLLTLERHRYQEDLAVAASVDGFTSVM